MKKITLALLLLSAFFVTAQKTCHTTEKMLELIQNNPEFELHNQETMDFIRNPKNASPTLNRSVNAVYTLPVVVHVLYKNGSQNISDAQILSQIGILNADYRKMNLDFNSVVPTAFRPLGADFELAFCMASRKPDGTATNGIERKSVASSFVFEDQYYTAAGLPVWDPTKYLNIWVGRFTDNSLLGFAYLPSIVGTSYANRDGLCIGDQFFGNTGTAQAPYNKGRTATHEIGHYFGLDHPWGDGSCSGDDGVADTPATNDAYYDCVSFPNNTYMCNPTTNGAMFMNFMDYVPDACMAFFTAGQKAIAQSTMNGPRASLKTSSGCQALSVTEQEAILSIAIYPNPVSQYFMITSPLTNVDLVEIFSTNGQLVKTQKLDEVNNKIYVDNFESGVYYIRIYNENKLLKSDKLIIK
ncbi:M43 family zinc metalloprotease [Flavobacterium sp.]